jgi:hypothetical protein
MANRPYQPSTHRVDAIQCVLLILSWCMAVALPVELIMFSYVVLGPLHYLTEIAWLDRRNYFLPKRTDAVCLAVCSVLGILASGWLTLLLTTDSPWLQFHVQFFAITMAMAAFVFALVLRSTVNLRWRIGLSASIVSCVAGYFYVNDVRLYHAIFAVLIPTLVHVFLFTGVFMFSGALKSRSMLGIVSVLLLCVGAMSLLYFDAGMRSTRNALSLAPMYQATFGFLERFLEPLIVVGTDTKPIEGAAWKSQIASFLAFVYTFHYLNWFSKTSIIHWHRISASTTAIIIVVWLGALALYISNHNAGLFAVGFLSLLHVFFEFPLNWASFDGLRVELSRVCRYGWAPPSAADSVRPG